MGALRWLQSLGAVGRPLLLLEPQFARLQRGDNLRHPEATRLPGAALRTELGRAQDEGLFLLDFRAAGETNSTPSLLWESLGMDWN